ncbi:MAG: hypothetical protein WD069_14190 [Planctomycetales bacterium]
MSRIPTCVVLWTTVATAALLQSADAAPPQPVPGPPHFHPAAPVHPATGYPPHAWPAAPVDVPYPYYYANGAAPGYPVLDAPMNPVPRPNIPVQVGATMITNQAFYPHEMLYPHRYRAMYPPFYYKMVGGWHVTPWGVRSHEHWQLQGTEVEVKYHSSISPFALFHPPSVR